MKNKFLLYSNFIFIIVISFSFLNGIFYHPKIAISAQCPYCDGTVCKYQTCGSSYATCDDMNCSCVPNCTGKECGDDGCGGSCGTCSTGYTCSNGKCVSSCTSNCTGKECGDDGCGGSCGTCSTGYTCSNGKCVSSDTCDGVCCSGTCPYGPGTGTCSGGKHCCENSCSCTPDCSCAANTCKGSTCSNGCGGTCNGTKDCGGGGGGGGSCTPDCSCAANTCKGSTCTDPKCGTSCSGTKDCGAGNCCEIGSTQSCTASDGCPGTQICGAVTSGICHQYGMGQWGSCVKNDPCCGVSCTPPAKCSQGQCVTVCTKCETTACNTYSPNKGNCASGYQWYCECSDYNASLGGYLKCEGECKTMPSGNMRCVNHKCAESSNTSYPVCDPNGGYSYGSKCGCTDYDKGSLYEACGDCGCKQNLSCCTKSDGTKVCLSSCAGQVCTPNSKQPCTVYINDAKCDGTQTCKSDGSGWGDCVKNDSNCGFKTCTWKECDADGVNCNVDKSGTFKYNESCPVGCETNGCRNEKCTWKTCENNDCTKTNTGIYPKGQCPKGCTSKNECTNTHTCTWKECDTTTHTCSITKTEDFPTTQSCPTGCTNDSQCTNTHTCTWKECDTTKQTCSITKTEDYPLGQSCPTGCTNDSQCGSQVSSSITLSADKTQVDIYEEVNFTANGNGDLNQSYGLDWNIGDTTPCKYHNNSWTDCGKFKNCTKMGGRMLFNDSLFDLSSLRNIPFISDFIKPAQAANLTATLTYVWTKNGTYSVYVQGKDINGNTVTSNTVTVTVGNNPPPPPAPCSIINFSINGKCNPGGNCPTPNQQNPVYVFINTPLKGAFSVTDTCKTCTLISTPASNDNWGNPPQTYSITTSNSSYSETFKITDKGTYSYTLQCFGSDPNDVATDNVSLQTVKAISLPIWREIIPNLGGFLKGLFKFK